MERVKLEGPAGGLPAGTVVLMIRGAHGAVTLEAWEHDCKAYGVLGIHRATPGSSCHSRACPCEYLPGKSCYADMSFTIGTEEAPSILAGYDTRAWVLMYQFYKERIDPEEETDEPG